MVEALSGKYLLRHPHTARLGQFLSPFCGGVCGHLDGEHCQRSTTTKSCYKSCYSRNSALTVAGLCTWNILESLHWQPGMGSLPLLSLALSLLLKSEAIPYAYSSPRGWIHRRPPVSGLEAGDASLRPRLDPRLLSPSCIVCVLFTFYTSVSLSLKTRGVG